MRVSKIVVSLLTIFITGMSFGGCGNGLTDEEGERQGVCFVNMECRRCCGQHNSGFNYSLQEFESLA